MNQTHRKFLCALVASVFFGLLVIFHVAHYRKTFRIEAEDIESMISVSKNCGTRNVITQNYLRKQAIVYPDHSTPYKLLNQNMDDYSQHQEVKDFTNKYFSGKKHGFFIEAGAYDGEGLSNTLALERHLNWTGLLIEPLSSSFSAMKAKNRKAFLLKACIADVCGMEEKLMTGDSAGAALAEEKHKDETFKVQCFSLTDILTALDVRHVDWMFLDMEGHEPGALKSFPWNTVTVDLIHLECTLPGTVTPNKKNIRFYKSFLESRGFEEQTSSKIDMLYRRKESALKSYTGGKRWGDYV